jgi:Arc/MetJ-type ribon-helix-helix transcriptional regulator
MLSKEEKFDKDLSNRCIATKLPVGDLQKIDDLVEAGIFLNSSDFLREAIRDKLRTIKIVNIRSSDYDTASEKEDRDHEKSFEDLMNKDKAKGNKSLTEIAGIFKAKEPLDSLEEVKKLRNK